MGKILFTAAIFMASTSQAMADAGEYDIESFSFSETQLIVATLVLFFAAIFYYRFLHPHPAE
ncbi:MAG: hypothetical protein OXR68_05250 [Alphaproteobacteria bacterium]|nr:hypothetical protein [Alphaproteobacteria bacterium]MDD9920010.1 hypothetical protein [Alphaproteobacteria bacterium]